MANYNAGDAFLRGAMGGVGMVMSADKFLRDREREPIIQQREDEMYAIQKRLADLGLDDAEDKAVSKKMLRDIDTIEIALQTGKQTPEALEAFNRVYAKHINRGGPTGAKKKVVNAYPTPDGSGFIPELEVTGKDGKAYRAPMTGPNRDDTDKDVLPLSFEDLFADLHNRKTALSELEQARVKYGDRTPITARAESAKAERQHKYKLEEIEAAQRARAKYYKSTWGARPSPDMQWIQLLTSPEIGMSKREAVDYLTKYRMTARTNPAETSRKIAQELMKSREKRGLMQGDPEYLTDEQINNLSRNMAEDLYTNFPSAPGLGLTLPPAKRGEMLKGASPVPGADPRMDYLLGPSGGSSTRMSVDVPARALQPRPTPGISGAEAAPPPQPQAQQPAQPAQQPQQAQPALPPQAIDALKANPGKAVRFANGQVWMLDQAGQPQRVK